MTLNYGLFDVSDPENPDRVYSAALLSRILSKHIRDGIVHGDGGELAVSASDPPAMTVKVATGTAMVQGRFCENDAALTLAVPAAHATYARIDRVVVRLNASPGRVIDILVKKGTPAPSPVPPGLTRTPETWELSLAQIFVAAGATMVQTANITDERRDATLCGWACATYLPSSQLEITGPVDMQGNALTGLPAPSRATDAARKEYVDEVIGGFGISQIAIDTDKNWNGKNITNVGTILATNYSLARMFVDVPGNTLRKQLDFNVSTSTGNTWVPVTSVAVPGNYHPSVDSNCRISVQVAFAASYSTPVTIEFRAMVDGRNIGTGSISVYGFGSPKTCTFNTTGGFVAGDSIAIEMKIADSDPQGGTATATGLTIQSSRATNQPVPATYVEAGTW